MRCVSRWPFLAIALAGFFGAHPARAQEETPVPDATPAPAGSEEDELALLFTSAPQSTLGSKSDTPTSVEDIAGDVTVISGDQIRALGCRTLSDVLALVPATFIGGDRTNDTAGIRGFALPEDPNNRVLLLLDGHVLVDAFQHYSAVDTGFPLDFETIDRVEVIAGPASPIYGSNAFFGVVNVVTRTPAPGHDVQGALSAGSFGYRRAEASWLGGSRAAAALPWTIAISATGRHIDGEVLQYDAATNAGIGSERNSDHDDDASLSLRATAGPIAVSAAFFGRERSLVDNVPPVATNDPDNMIGVRHAFVDVSASLLRRETISLRARAWSDAVRILEHLDYTTPPPFIYRSDSRETGTELVAEWIRGRSDLVVTGGGSLVDAKQTASPSQDNRVLRATVQERYRLGTLGHLEAGLFAESSSDFSGRIAPRLGVVLHPWWGSTFKAIVARGFRDPSLFEAGSTPRSLYAETLDDAELVGSQRLTVPIAGRRIPLELFGSAFYDEGHGFLVRAVDYSFFNDAAGVYATGGTAGVRWSEKNSSVRADFSGFYQEHRPDYGGLPGTPGWIAHVVATHRAGDHLSLGLALSGIGRRVDRNGENALLPYGLLDASIAYLKIARLVDLRVTGSNLFDVRYVQPSGSDYESPVIPGRRRAFYAEVRAGF